MNRARILPWDHGDLLNFCSCFEWLGEMQIHLISIEISVVRCRHREIHSECWPRKDLQIHFVFHFEIRLSTPISERSNNYKIIVLLIWSINSRPYSFPIAHFDSVSHHRHLVECWLSIEDDNISISHMSFHSAYPSFINLSLSSQWISHRYPGWRWRSAALGWYLRSTLAPFSLTMYFAPGYCESPRFTSSCSL